MDMDTDADIAKYTKTVRWQEDDGSGEWLVVRKLGGIKAMGRDGSPIIVKSHETAYRIGYNIGLRDCMWWCPTRVEDYEQKYGVDKEK